MPKFEVGDLVKMPYTPFAIQVMELGTCDDGDKCQFGGEIFRFTDPELLRDDWMHTAEFEKV